MDNRYFLQAHLSLRSPGKRSWWLAWGIMLYLELIGLMVLEEYQTTSLSGSQHTAFGKGNWMVKLMIFLQAVNPTFILSSIPVEWVIIFSIVVSAFSVFLLCLYAGLIPGKIFGLTYQDRSCLNPGVPNKLFHFVRFFSYYAELPFLLMVIILTKTIPCHNISLDKTELNGINLLETNVYNLNSFDLKAVSDTVSYASVSNLNDDLSCKGVQHILTVILCLVAVIGFFLWVLFSHRLANDVPDPIMPLAKNGSSSLYHVNLICVILVAKMLVVDLLKGVDQKSRLDFFYLFSMLLLAISAFYQLYRPAYFNSTLSLGFMRKTVAIFSFSVLMFTENQVYSSNKDTLKFLGLFIGLMVFTISIKLLQNKFVSRTYQSLEFNDINFLESAFALLERLNLEKSASADTRLDIQDSLLLSNSDYPTNEEIIFHTRRIKVWLRDVFQSNADILNDVAVLPNLQPQLTNQIEAIPVLKMSNFALRKNSEQLHTAKIPGVTPLENTRPPSPRRSSIHMEALKQEQLQKKYKGLEDNPDFRRIILDRASKRDSNIAKEEPRSERSLGQKLNRKGSLADSSQELPPSTPSGRSIGSSKHVPRKGSQNIGTGFSKFAHPAKFSETSALSDAFSAIDLVNKDSHPKQTVDSLKPLIASVEKLLIHRLLFHASVYARRPDPMFARLTNLLVSLSLLHNRDIFRTAHLVNLVSMKASSCGMANSDSRMKIILALAKRLIILKANPEEEPVKYTDSLIRPSVVSLDKPSYNTLFGYLTNFEKVKTLMTDILAVRKQFADELFNNGAEASWAYGFSEKFTKLVEEVKLTFKKMRSKHLDIYTPVALVEHNFSFHVLQDESKAGPRLLNTLYKKFSSKLQVLTQDVEIKNSEIIVMVASLEKEDFQKILLATANVGRALQYNASDLVGKEVLEIIPEPIRSIHARLCHPATAKGNRTTQDIWMNLPIRRKNGFVRRFEFKIRLCNHLADGLRGIMILKNKKMHFDESMIIVDEQGTIIEMDEMMAANVERNVSIGDYNYELYRALKTSLMSQKHFLIKGVPNAECITNDKSFLVSYKQDLALRQGQNVLLRTTHGDKYLRARVKLQTIYIKQTETLVRILYFDWINTRLKSSEQNLSQVNFESISEIENLEPGETTLIKILEYLQETVKVQIEHGGSSYWIRHPAIGGDTALQADSKTYLSVHNIPMYGMPDSTKLIGTEMDGNNVSFSHKPLIKRKFSNATKTRQSMTSKTKGLTFNDFDDIESDNPDNYGDHSDANLKLFQKNVLLQKDEADSNNWNLPNPIVTVFTIVLWLLLLCLMIFSYVAKKQFAQFRNDMAVGLPALDNLAWAMYMGAPFVDIFVTAEAGRKGLISQDFMRSVFPDESLAQAVEAQKQMVLDPSVKLVMSIQTRILNTSIGKELDWPLTLITEKNIKRETISEFVGSSPKKDLFSFQEYLMALQPKFDKYLSLPESDLPAEEDSQRQALLDSLRQNVYQLSMTQYLKIEDESVKMFLKAAQSIVHSVIKWMSLSYTALFLVVMLCYILLMIGRYSLKNFYKRYFYLKKADVKTYRDSLYAMDIFWENLLADQWLVYRKKQAIYFFKKGGNQLSRMNPNAGGMTPSIKRNAKLLDKYSNKEESGDEVVHRSDAFNKSRKLLPYQETSPFGIAHFPDQALESTNLVRSPEDKRRLELQEKAKNERIKFTENSQPVRSSGRLILAAAVFMLLGSFGLLTYNDYSGLLSSTKMLKNYVDIYVTTAQLYYSESQMASLLLNQIVHPEVSTYAGRPIEKLFDYRQNQLSDEVAPALERMLGEDLGAFNENFKTIIDQLTVCDINTLVGGDAVSRYYVYEPACGIGALSFQISTVSILMRKMSSMYGEIFTNIQGYAPEDRHLLAKDPRWIAIIRNQLTDSVIGAVYYLLLLALSPALADLLKFDGPEPGLVLGSARDKLFFSLQIMLLAVGAVILLTAVVAPAERTLRIFRNTCLLLPWRLALQNPLLSHHFRR